MQQNKYPCNQNSKLLVVVQNHKSVFFVNEKLEIYTLLLIVEASSLADKETKYTPCINAKEEQKLI